MRVHASSLLVALACVALVPQALGQYPSNPRGTLPLNGSASGTAGQPGHLLPDSYSVSIPEDGTIDVTLTDNTVGSQPCSIAFNVQLNFLIVPRPSPNEIRIPLKKGEFTNSVMVNYRGTPCTYALTSSFSTPLLPNDVEPNDTVATATPLALGQSTTGHIGYIGDTKIPVGNGFYDADEDDRDMYRINVAEASRVQFSAQAAEDSLRLKLDLRDANGKVLTASDGGSAATITFDASAGTYFVAVSLAPFTTLGSQAWAGSYRLTASTLCVGNCVAISGHAVVPGSIAIKGDGTAGRQVTILDAAGNATGLSSPIAADGSYSVLVPPGSYRVGCELAYNDRYYDVVKNFGSIINTTRHVKSTTGVYSVNRDTTVDCAFSTPIVFLHGILSSAEKWQSWQDTLGRGHADIITFTPTYGDLDDYEKEAEMVYEEIEADFKDLFAATPKYDVVAHSKGGIVARVLKGAHGGTPLADALSAAVLLGTPNNGSNCASSLLANVTNLSRCDLQDGVNSRYAAWTIPVYAIAGTETSRVCLLDGQPNDGIVPVDSVFNVTHNDGGLPVSQRLSGVVVPYKHTDLGDGVTSWLIDSVILPFFSGGSAAVAGRACPSSYSTAAADCRQTRPASTLCLEGRGLTADGRCTVIEPGQSGMSVFVSWTPPASGTPLAAPNSTVATIDIHSPCDGASAPRATGEQIAGYHIYRSASPITDTSSAVRVGDAAGNRTSFTDPTPQPGVNYYAVTAVYDTGESAAAAAPPVVLPKRQRAARH
jgi:hypothetical protein